MKIVLLNPPGNERYVRSYYCGSTSKAGYLFQPLDLLVVSGILSAGNEIAVVDGIAERLHQSAAVQRIAAFKADAVVCMVSIVSWNTDRECLSSIKKALPSVKIIANGDVFFDDPVKQLENNGFIDAVIFDFISDNIPCYLTDRWDDISNMVWRDGNRIVERRGGTGPKTFELPVPRHELFLNPHYRFPFVRHRPHTAVITNFGCPFRCSFCIAHALGFKYRPSANVMEELRRVVDLNVREIFFEDMTFGVPRENAIALCRAMISERLRLSWTCYSRIDVVDRELLDLMKRAGCHTIMFGVESASEKIRDLYNKDLERSKIIESFRACRAAGVKTVATFIFGLPEDDEQSCLDTIAFAKTIGCDYASFNVAVPRPGTGLRKRALENKTIEENDVVFDHSGKTVFSLSKSISQEKLAELRRRAVREFYFRPGYIISQLLRIRSFTELVEHFREFLSLLGK
jgi:anaerobic magnesium-protoporphyrin IX monomethyl ester cyclase